MSTEHDSDGLNEIENLLKGIQLQCDSADLKRRLNECAITKVKEWRDKCSLDLMHHCILNNNMMAVMLFISRGLFKPPHRPSTWPYLHLASCLGRRALITTCIQELHYQNQSLLLDWKVFDLAIRPKMTSVVHNFKEEDKLKKLSPIDLASLFSHSACVQLLLDFWHFQNARTHLKTSRSSIKGPSKYLSLACQANSPSALRLMLQEYDDKREALEFAIRMSSAECVDVVLRDKNSQLDLNTVFQGMNLFHVLYSYSRCTNQNLLEAMVEVTSVLIFHKHDVNSCRPSRTFPLYSLLSKSVVGVAVEDLIPNLTSTLLLLLKAGADPNLDEILIEHHVRDTEHTTAFGRKPFSSAVNCLISSVTALRGKSILENTDDNQHAEKYSYNCLELLLRHGADLSHNGKFFEISEEAESISDVYHTGTALHVFFSTRKYTLPSYPFLRLLLHYGINTDAQGLWHAKNIENPITYALNVLPFSLLTHFSSTTDLEHDGLNEDDLKLFVYTMKFMSQTSLQKAFSEFNECIDSLRNCLASTIKDEVETKHISGNKVYQKMVEAFVNELSTPWLLQRCCSHTVWKSCRYHMGNIYSLPIPMPLKRIIMNYH